MCFSLRRWADGSKAHFPKILVIFNMFCGKYATGSVLFLVSSCFCLRTLHVLLLFPKYLLRQLALQCFRGCSTFFHYLLDDFLMCFWSKYGSLSKVHRCSMLSLLADNGFHCSLTKVLEMTFESCPWNLIYVLGTQSNSLNFFNIFTHFMLTKTFHLSDF